jgi:hypothetical protein
MVATSALQCHHKADHFSNYRKPNIYVSCWNSLAPQHLEGYRGDLALQDLLSSEEVVEWIQNRWLCAR